MTARRFACTDRTRVITLVLRGLIVCGFCAATLSLCACTTVPFPRLRVYPLPSPVTFAGERVPVNRPSVQSRISGWYNYYLTKPWLIARWVERERQLFPYLQATLAREGLPKDLAYVAVAESDLQPRAISDAGAAGIWQLMPATAKRLGLTMNTFVDERFDYRDATEAATTYFRQAEAQVGGAWLLAVAAYNLGGYGVTQRIERQKTNDFWDMVFPSQTENYVPRIIAIKLIMEHAAQLGIRPKERLPILQPVTITVVGKPVYLSDVAAYLGLTFREVWEDNPQIWKPYLPPGQYRLYLPEKLARRAGELSDYLNSLPYERALYTARGGQTVAQVAASLGLTADELATFNKLEVQQILKKGQTLFYWRRVPPLHPSSGDTGVGTSTAEPPGASAEPLPTETKPARPQPVGRS